ncbi:MAG: hypothetical protein DWQ36_10275, partial [Acidobacteria bacterium]
MAPPLRPVRRVAAFALVLGSLSMPTSLDAAAPGTPSGLPRQEAGSVGAPALDSLLEPMLAARAEAGLEPLARSPELDAAAREQADFLATGEGLSLELPGGLSFDELLNRHGYDAGLSSQKLGSINVNPISLVRAWAAAPADSADSLFHPEMRDVGIATAERTLASGEVETVLVLIVADELESLVRRRFAPLERRLAVRSEMVAATNRARGAVGRSPLEGDERLHRVADRFAAQLAAAEAGEALFEAPESAVPAARRRRGGRGRPPDLVDLAREEGYRAKFVRANELRGTVETAKVLDAWMRSPSHQQNLVDLLVSDVGIGFG